jgi:hypothetical protein
MARGEGKAEVAFVPAVPLIIGRRIAAPSEHCVEGGFEASADEYVVFLDADDVLPPA